MKKFIYIFIVFIFCFSFFYVPQKPCHAQADFYYTTNVEHLFTHGLIAYPEIAFNKNNFMAKHYHQDCITKNEFLNILTSLYQNNYVLININDCFETINNTTVKKSVKVPIGKKPIILSFDDINYDSKKLGLGMVDKIILDHNQNLATSTLINGKEDISYNNEFVTILENFVKEHPSFSPYGAKGTINLTGYDGILGYRTSHTNKANQESEITRAKAVANCLLNLGWTFASHSYGHYHMNKISLNKFENELKLWKSEVEPIVGKTQVYVYPYGEWQVFENGNICQKHKLLNQYGFNLFCGVGLKTFFGYLPNKNGHKVLFMDRKNLDGNSLCSNHPELKIFFNPQQILDEKRNFLN